MKLVRSDTPEVIRIASTGTLACWGWSALPLACIASVPGVLIALAVSFIVSVRAAAWLGLPIVLVSNVYLLWRGRSHRLNWVIAGCADRICIRLFVRRGRGQRDANEQNAIMLEASEIASMSARTVEVFLDGPKPRIVESLVIEPAQPIAEGFSNDAHSFRCSSGLLETGKQSFVANEKGRLTIEWKWCCPALRVFLQQVAQECPSVVIAHEKRSELDLNGIWRGISRNLRSNLSAQERQKLVQAGRLGFGWDCRWLLCRYKHVSFQKAAAYMAEIEREEAGTGRSAVRHKAY